MCLHWCSLAFSVAAWLDRQHPATLHFLCQLPPGLAHCFLETCPVLYFEGSRESELRPLFPSILGPLLPSPPNQNLFAFWKWLIFSDYEKASLPRGLRCCWLSHSRAEQPGQGLCPSPLWPLSPDMLKRQVADLPCGSRFCGSTVAFMACFMPALLNLLELSPGIIGVSVFLSFNACDCWVRRNMLFVPFPNNVSVESTRTDYSSAAGS